MRNKNFCFHHFLIWKYKVIFDSKLWVFISVCQSEIFLVSYFFIWEDFIVLDSYAIFPRASFFRLFSESAIIHMPGGDLQVEIDKDREIIQSVEIWMICKCLTLLGIFVFLNYNQFLKIVHIVPSYQIWFLKIL